jgi:hypothetical protein
MDRIRTTARPPEDTSNRPPNQLQAFVRIDVVAPNATVNPHAPRFTNLQTNP